LAQHFLQVSPLQLRLMIANQLGRCGIQRDHALLRINRQDPFDHAGQHRFLLVALFVQCAASVRQVARQFCSEP